LNDFLIAITAGLKSFWPDDILSLMPGVRFWPIREAHQAHLSVSFGEKVVSARELWFDCMGLLCDFFIR